MFLCVLCLDSQQLNSHIPLAKMIQYHVLLTIQTPHLAPVSSQFPESRIPQNLLGPLTVAMAYGRFAKVQFANVLCRFTNVFLQTKLTYRRHIPDTETDSLTSGKPTQDFGKLLAIGEKIGYALYWSQDSVQFFFNITVPYK